MAIVDQTGPAAIFETLSGARAIGAFIGACYFRDMPRGKATSTDEDRAFDAAVGLRIRDLRLASGRTQTDVARVAGVTFQQLQKYERGENRVAASRLAAIARSLDTSGSYLLGEDGSAPPPLDRDTRRFLDVYSDCSASSRDVLLQLAKVLAQG